MEDRIGADKIEYIVSLYEEIRNMFFDAGTGVYDPQQENRHFVKEVLGFPEDTPGFSDLVEGTDLFLGNVHSIFTIRVGESFADVSNAVGVLSDFVYGDERAQEPWIEPFLVAIRSWIENLNFEVEIPY